MIHAPSCRNSHNRTVPKSPNTISPAALPMVTTLFCPSCTWDMYHAIVAHAPCAARPSHFVSSSISSFSNSASWASVSKPLAKIAG